MYHRLTIDVRISQLVSELWVISSAGCHHQLQFLTLNHRLPLLTTLQTRVWQNILFWCNNCVLSTFIQTKLFSGQSWINNGHCESYGYPSAESKWKWQQQGVRVQWGKRRLGGKQSFWGLFRYLSNITSDKNFNCWVCTIWIVVIWINFSFYSVQHMPGHGQGRRSFHVWTSLLLALFTSGDRVTQGSGVTGEI